MDLVIVHDLFLNETANYAHVFLPGSTFLEKNGTFTNAERRIGRVRKVMPPLAGYADWEVTCLLSEALGYTMAYSHPSEIMDEIAALTALGAVLFGTLLGLVAGFFRRLDAPIMRVVDAMMAFPDILLAIALVAILGASLGNVVLALVLVYTPRVARVVRASTLVVRELLFIEAVRALTELDFVNGGGTGSLGRLAAADTLTEAVFVAVAPALSVTVRVTVYVPAAV